MKKAWFCKEMNQFEYWNSRNTTICVQCETMKMAESIVKNSGVVQVVEKSIKG